MTGLKTEINLAAAKQISFCQLIRPSFKTFLAVLLEKLAGLSNIGLWFTTL